MFTSGQIPPTRMGVDITIQIYIERAFRNYVGPIPGLVIHCIPRSSWADKTRSYPSKSRYKRYASRQLIYVFTQDSVDIWGQTQVSDISVLVYEVYDALHCSI